MIIYNIRALLSVVPAVAITLCVQRLLGQGSPRKETIAVVIGALVCAGLDAADRWHNGRSDNRVHDLIHPRSGGHVFFVPIWAWAFVVMLGSLFST